MTDLRFETSDGEYLHLEGADGTTYRLLIDDGVRRALRKDVATEQDALKISPRDIQLEVRAGLSIDDIVAKTGATFEYVEKFAAPVLAELAHVVSSAQSVRITMAGDRYSETTQVEFGTVIATRLAGLGIVSSTWSAKKSDNGGWQVHCHYDQQVATWAFDPKKLALSPENENAISLSTQQSLTDGPVPKLRPVVITSGDIAQTQLISPEDLPTPPVLRSVSTATQTPSAAEVEETAIAPAAPEAKTSTDGPATVVPGGADDLSHTANLLDALRKRRLDRELGTTEGSATAVDEQPITTTGFVPPFGAETRTVEPAGALAAQTESGFEEESGFEAETGFEAEIEPEVAAEFDSFVEEPVTEELKPKKPGRTSMPSWDEIVFSTKTDED